MSPIKTSLKPPKILVVDDDELSVLSLAAALEGAGYRVVQARDGLQGLEAAEREKPALILLDVDMPKANGWQTLKELRRRDFTQPIVMLTGHKEIEDRVKGLSDGADDYLTKPCDQRELLARIHAVLRRSQPAAADLPVLRFGALTVDLVNRTASSSGEKVGLTRTEYAILELFARNEGKLLTREFMLDAVWGYGPQSNTRTVDTHIWRLRQKIKDNAGEPKWIQTVTSGSGYRMVCDSLAKSTPAAIQRNPAEALNEREVGN